MCQFQSSTSRLCVDTNQDFSPSVSGGKVHKKKEQWNDPKEKRLPCIMILEGGDIMSMT